MSEMRNNGLSENGQTPPSQEESLLHLRKQVERLTQENQSLQSQMNKVESEDAVFVDWLFGLLRQGQPLTEKDWAAATSKLPTLGDLIHEMEELTGNNHVAQS